jgi:pilus assembly protein Flp/PilA
MRNMMRRMLRCTRGGTAIEYGLICALVILAMMASLKLFAGATLNMWGNVTTAYQNAAP